MVKVNSNLVRSCGLFRPLPVYARLDIVAFIPLYAVVLAYYLQAESIEIVDTVASDEESLGKETNDSNTSVDEGPHYSWDEIISVSMFVSLVFAHLLCFLFSYWSVKVR